MGGLLGQEASGCRVTTDLPSFGEMRDRIDRLLRGENIAAAAIEAGTIPAYYGHEHPFDAWRRMWATLSAARTLQPYEVAFCQAGTIGWASR